MPGKIKTAPGGKGNRYKGAGCSSFMFVKVGIRLFLLHSGAMPINLGSPIYCYIVLELQFVVAASIYW